MASCTWRSAILARISGTRPGQLGAARRGTSERRRRARAANQRNADAMTKAGRPAEPSADARCRQLPRARGAASGSRDLPGPGRYHSRRSVQVTPPRALPAAAPWPSRSAPRVTTEDWIMAFRRPLLHSKTRNPPQECGRASSSIPAASRPRFTRTGRGGLGLRGEEGQGPGAGVRVVLSRAAGSAVTVDYATSDGSAQTGRGGVLDDSHDEGEQILTLRLSNASSGRITDAGGERNDREQRPAAAGTAGGLGRAAAVHAVEHVEERLEEPRETGFTGPHRGRGVAVGHGGREGVAQTPRGSGRGC